MVGAVAGCAVGPDYHLPAISMPGVFLAQAGEKSLAIGRIGERRSHAMVARAA